MGQVWRAREVATGRSVALKLLDPAHSGDEQTLARLEIEGETLTRLREAGAHEHIVPILDFQITDEQACLVMEFIPGLNLKKWCETHRLPPRERVKLIAQVAHAAGWFHRHGIVHRDLKPANILVSSVTQQPVIVDFSIAKQDEGLTLTLTNEALGTAPYMAPEQIDRTRGQISPATDVYGIGATLYELLTQVHPHPGDLTQVVRRHAEEILPAPPSALNPDIPRDLECIILKALSHRPTDRYVDGTALAEDLDRFLSGEPVQARPLPLATRLARRARRKPALTAALAACVLIGSFALWNVQRQAAQRERFALQTRLTTAMQNHVWTSQNLADAEVALAALTEHDTQLAVQVRQRFHDDVVHDMEARLQQNHLRDDDYAWLQTLNTWLQPRSPNQAARLQDLITERSGRWETRADLRAPFTDLQGIFAGSHVQVRDGLLYPLYPPGTDPYVTVTKNVSIPMEVACTVQAQGPAFQHFSLVYNTLGARVATGLYRIRDLSITQRRILRLSGAAAESFVMTLKLNEDTNRIVHVPDVNLLDQPLRFTLRVERDWAEVDINGRHAARVDFSFAQAAGPANNSWRLTWHKDVGLKELTLRTRRADATSPLEEADLAAMQGRYAEAIRRYETLRGDPQFGVEAAFKTGECRYLQGELSVALPVWEALLAGPPSTWRDRALLRLWTHSATTSQGNSSDYLTLLPEPLPANLFGLIRQAQIDQLEAVCASVGMGVALPRVDVTKVAEAAKTMRLLRFSTVQIANRFALAHHAARLDQEANELFRRGLQGIQVASNTVDNLLAATSCFDQWCRLNPSENNPALAQYLAGWRKQLPASATLQSIARMEDARRAARAGAIRNAVLHLEETHSAAGEMDGRVHTSLWLLRGMLFRLQQGESRAQSAWTESLKVADKVAMKSPLHLMDCVMLHSLTGTWNTATAGEVLTTLAGRHLRGDARTAAQTAFNEALLADPTWITTFNTVLQSEEGRQFAEDYALCRQPPRELFQRLYRLLFEHYFLTTAFPQATPEQTARVHQIVDTLVTEMAMNPRGEISHLYAYLRAWNDPAAAKTLFDTVYPYSPALIKDMQWLLQQRHPR